MRRAIAVVIVLVGAASALAQSAGSVDINGYVWQGGYWVKDGYQYTRTLYQNPGYWYNGCYFQGSYHYRYTLYSAPQVAYVAPKVPTYSDPDWRAQLLNIAAARDKQEGEIRKAAFEQQYFTEAVKALGLEGNFRWNGYGTVPPYLSNGYGAMPFANGLYQMQGHYNFGVNGSTQYGYSSIANLYGDTDLNQLFLQAAQLTQNAQKLSGEATSNFQGLVGQEGSNRAKVAEILAKGQVAREVISALTSSDFKSFSFKISPVGMIEKDDSKVDAGTKAVLRQQWGDLAAAKCASCHSGNKTEGKFDIGNYLSMSQQEKQDRVWSRLTTDDPTRRMPKDGPKLTSEELRLFFLN